MQAWGTLNRETINSTVRQRSFGMNSAMRFYNEAAAPGIGSLWFVRQLYPSLIALYLADDPDLAKIGVSRITLANSIEALSCALTLRNDPKAKFTLGRRKFQNHLEESGYFTFSRLRRPGIYVRGPFRVSCVEPLRALGLVRDSSRRFNGYALSALGKDAAKAILAEAPESVQELKRWLRGSDRLPGLSSLFQMDGPAAARVRKILKDALFGVRKPDPVQEQRGRIRDWLSALNQDDSEFTPWSVIPSQFQEDSDYWATLHEAAAFIAFQNSLRNILTAVEALLDEGEKRDISALLRDLETKFGTDLFDMAEKAAEVYLKMHSAHSNAGCAELAAARERAQSFASSRGSASRKLLLAELCSEDDGTFEVTECSVRLLLKRSDVKDRSKDTEIQEAKAPDGPDGILRGLPPSLRSFRRLALDLTVEGHKKLVEEMKDDKDNEEDEVIGEERE